MTESAGRPPAAPIRHHTAQVGDGLRLHHLRCRREDQADDDPLVVLLHGWPETSRAWRKVMPLLAGAGHDVLAPDLRGLGASGRPPGGYDKVTLAADVRALVEIVGRRGIACLVGHDIGAMVAFAYALRWPDEVGRIVLSEALLPGLGLEAMYGSNEPGRFPFMAFHMTPDMPEALVTGREAAYLGWFYRNLAHDPAAIGPEEAAANVADYAQPGALRAGFEHYRAFPRDAEDNKALLAERGGRVPVPVLTVCGATGVGDGLRRSLEGVASRLRGVVLEECGHWVAAERPDRFAEEVAAFCAAEGE